MPQTRMPPGMQFTINQRVKQKQTEVFNNVLKKQGVPQESLAAGQAWALKNTIPPKRN